MCRVEIDGTLLEMMIDTGASVNLLDESTFRRMSNSGNQMLKPSQTKIYLYGSANPLPVLGTFIASIKSNTVTTTTQLHVVKGTTGNLLSYNTAQKLGLIVMSVNTATVAEKTENRPDSIKKEFKPLFGDVGKVRNKMVKLDVDPEEIPRQQPHRRFLFMFEMPWRKRLKGQKSLISSNKLMVPLLGLVPLSSCQRNLELSESVLICVRQTKQSREKNT